MSNTKGNDYILINIKNFIDEKAEYVINYVNSKCELWQLVLDGLRTEWQLEHKNLVQRYETSENAKAIAKIEVDKHFESINSLQTRMDKLSASFISKENLKKH